MLGPFWFLILYQSETGDPFGVWALDLGVCIMNESLYFEVVQLIRFKWG